MTAIPTINGSASAGALVPDELIDSLIESVVLPHNPLARAVLICNLLREMCAAVVWLHGTEMTRDDAAHEVASLRQSVAAAQDHQRQMETFGADGAETAATDELVCLRGLPGRKPRVVLPDRHQARRSCW
jgi:hypothetical protein